MTNDEDIAKRINKLSKEIERGFIKKYERVIKLFKQLENIQRPELYDYDIKKFSKEQKKKLEKLKINSLMITGKLLSISPECYYRLEKTEAPFLITDEFIKAGLLFKFDNGKIELKEILESKNILKAN